LLSVFRLSLSLLLILLVLPSIQPSHSFSSIQLFPYAQRSFYFPSSLFNILAPSFLFSLFLFFLLSLGEGFERKQQCSTDGEEHDVAGSDNGMKKLEKVVVNSMYV
jgi:hypothetical protein